MPQQPQALLTNFTGAVSFAGAGSVLGNSHGVEAKNGVKAFSIVVGPAPITITSMEVYIRVRDTVPDTVVGGIYSDNEGQPGSVLVDFDNLTVPGTAPTPGAVMAPSLFTLSIANAKGMFVLAANTHYWFVLGGVAYTSPATTVNSTPLWSSPLPAAAPSVPSVLGTALTFGEFRISLVNGTAWTNGSTVNAVQLNGFAAPVGGTPASTAPVAAAVPAAATMPSVSDKPGLTLSEKLVGHSEYINCVAFSPDGKILASGSRDKTVRLWDLATGTQKSLLWKHADFVGSVAFSPDGRSLASGGWDDKIRQFDMSSGDEISEGKFDKNKNAVLSLAFSPSGRRLASGSNDKTARNFSASTGIAESSGVLPDAVASVAFSPDGTRLAGACLDGSVYVWDESSMHLLKKLTPHGHVGSLFCVAFIDNDTVAAAGKAGVVDVWTLPSGEPVAALSAGSSEIYGLAYSARKHLLAAGGTDKLIRLWTLASIRGAKGGTVSPFATASGHTDTVRTIAFSPTGDLLATGGWDYNILVWRVKAPAP